MSLGPSLEYLAVHPVFTQLAEMGWVDNYGVARDTRRREQESTGSVEVGQPLSPVRGGW